MSDYETPLIRDLSKMMPSVLLGLLIVVGGIVFFVFPFNLTVYGDHCTMTKSYSIAKWIVESLTISC